jgi:hypothetical protein
MTIAGSQEGTTARDERKGDSCNLKTRADKKNRRKLGINETEENEALSIK